MVDDEIDHREARRRILAEDVGLDVDEYETVVVGDLVGRDDLDVDADGLAQRLVLGALDLAERDDRRRRAFAAEQRPERVGRGDAVGIGIGLEQDRDALAVVEQTADLGDAVEVREVVELLVDVVADQGLPAGAAKLPRRACGSRGPRAASRDRRR
jgi:hypothetical protein